LSLRTGAICSLLMHGDKDTLVSPSQTEILHQSLIAHGIESTRYVVKGAEHGGPENSNPRKTRLGRHIRPASPALRFSCPYFTPILAN
jgi:acetyl esterase/lipase